MDKKIDKAARSKVTVTFLDGEVKEYMISAGSGISKYLADQASDGGILCFLDFNNRASLSIPVANIRDWHIQEIEFIDKNIFTSAGGNEGGQSSETAEMEAITEEIGGSDE